MSLTYLKTQVSKSPKLKNEKLLLEAHKSLLWKMCALKLLCCFKPLALGLVYSFCNLRTPSTQCRTRENLRSFHSPELSSMLSWWEGLFCFGNFHTVCTLQESSLQLKSPCPTPLSPHPRDGSSLELCLAALAFVS